MRLQVIRRDGVRLSIGRSLGRTALNFIPWELSHTSTWQLVFVTPVPMSVMYVGYLFVLALIAGNLVSLLTSKTHQALYDRLAGTCVVQRQRRDLRRGWNLVKLGNESLAPEGAVFAAQQLAADRR